MATLPLDRSLQVLTALMLALANFIVILDMTVANVSVPHIAGGLAVSPSQGTYVITSYAVAEAVIVPLTGWLAGRFGSVRVFAFSMMMFGVFSAMCGLSTTLGMLIVSRIFQGLAGGTLIPLSQTLLVRIFPKQQLGRAMALWSMTTLVAPIMGPVLGGYISDHWGWEFIFFINVPVAVLCSGMVWNVLKRHETERKTVGIDRGGLCLLVVWVAALQIMLDRGKELDWFGSPFIVAMALIALVGFVVFLIWELTAAHPIVDLTIFRYRGFTSGTLTISLAFGGFFATMVLAPLWMQTSLGYTAVDAGTIMGMNGILAISVAPFVARTMHKVDTRKYVFFGVMWLAMMVLARSFYATNVDYWGLALPVLAQGIGMPFFFIPLTTIALASVAEHEVAAAAGLFSFCRSLAGAVATSVATTIWENDAAASHAQLVGRIDPTGQGYAMLVRQGMRPQEALVFMDNMLQQQAVMLATNHVFQIMMLALIVAACSIWLAPKPEAAGGKHSLPLSE